VVFARPDTKGSGDCSTCPRKLLLSPKGLYRSFNIRHRRPFHPDVENPRDIGENLPATLEAVQEL
jgi:hypothetical protein